MSEVWSSLHCISQTRQTSKHRQKSLVKFSFYQIQTAVTHHRCRHYYQWTAPSYGPNYSQLTFYYLMLIICLFLCFGFLYLSATVGKNLFFLKKCSWKFKATRQLRWQLKQSSLDRQQQVERQQVTVCSRLSCQAYYCNDFYCFKMLWRTPETQCMKVISFHCEQTEASLRGNRPMVWPFQ